MAFSLLKKNKYVPNHYPQLFHFNGIYTVCTEHVFSSEMVDSDTGFEWFFEDGTTE